MPGFGNEAIAKIRYTIKADGTVDDVQITEYMMANPFLDNMLKGTVGKWTFKPGTLNGKPVDYLNQEYLFVSRVDPNAPPPPAPVAQGSRTEIKLPAKTEMKKAMKPADPAQMAPIPLAVSLKAKQTIDAAYEQLKNKDFDNALKALDEVASKDLHTVFDFALVNQLRSSAFSGINRPYEALEALELATMYGIGPKGEKTFFLEDKLLEQALRQKFLIATSLRHNKLAWDTFQLLQEKFPPAADDKIHVDAKAVKALLDSPDQLALLARIPADKTAWTHVPSRRIFTVADVKGKLEKVTARCERRTVDLKYQENADWTLPPSFGACSLDFVGDKGTQFTVYEFNQ